MLLCSPCSRSAAALGRLAQRSALATLAELPPRVYRGNLERSLLLGHLRPLRVGDLRMLLELRFHREVFLTRASLQRVRREGRREPESICV